MSFSRLCPRVGEILYEVGLLVGAEHEVHTVDGAHRLGLELCIASCDHDKGPGILAYHAMDGLTAFVISHFGHRAGVDQADVGVFALLCCDDAHLAEQLAKGGGFREVELAAECVVGCFLALEGTGIDHASFLFYAKVLFSHDNLTVEAGKSEVSLLWVCEILSKLIVTLKIKLYFCTIKKSKLECGQ